MHTTFSVPVSRFLHSRGNQILLANYATREPYRVFRSNGKRPIFIMPSVGNWSEFTVEAISNWSQDIVVQIACKKW